MKKGWLLFLLIAVASGGYFYYQQNQAEEITYLTEPVRRGDLQKSVIATGTIRALHRVEVGAQASGRIEKIWVTLGQKIKEGDLIAEIDSQNQRNALETAQAKLESYRAQLNARNVAFEIAQSNYQRNQKLYAQKSTSLNEFENTKNQLATAQAAIKEISAAIKQAEIEVKNAQTNLDYTKIRAPISATVISIPVSEGQTVNASQTTPTIVQVADLSRLLIKFEISEGDITKIHPQMEVVFSTLANPDHRYHSQISTIDPALTTLTDDEYVESVSNTKAVYFYANSVIDNLDNTLRIGMTAQAEIIIANAKNSLLVPTMTLKREGEKVFVNVLNGNQVEKREVQIGLNDEHNTQILDGLVEGEKVISSQVTSNEQVGNALRRPRIF